MPQRKDPVLESEEWKTNIRPHLHRLDNDLTKLLMAEEISAQHWKEMRDDLEIMALTVKGIVGNGEEGMIDKKIAKAIDKSRNELIHDVSMVMQKAFSDRDKVKQEQWDKYKLAIFGGGVTVVVGVLLNIIEFISALR